MKSPEMALRVALMIRAFFKGYLSEEEFKTLQQEGAEVSRIIGGLKVSVERRR